MRRTIRTSRNLMVAFSFLMSGDDFRQESDEEVPEFELEMPTQPISGTHAERGIEGFLKKGLSSTLQEQASRFQPCQHPCWQHPCCKCIPWNGFVDRSCWRNFHLVSWQIDSHIILRIRCNVFNVPLNGVRTHGHVPIFPTAKTNLTRFLQFSLSRKGAHPPTRTDFL